jgi:hypothetical protein
MTNATSTQARPAAGVSDDDITRDTDITLELDAGELVITSRVTISIDIRELVPGYLCDAPELEELKLSGEEWVGQPLQHYLNVLDFATEHMDEDLTARALALFAEVLDDIRSCRKADADARALRRAGWGLG